LGLGGMLVAIALFLDDAIAFYNDSVASGELYRFDEQGQKLEHAKKIDKDFIEQLSQNPSPQKIAM